MQMGPAGFGGAVFSYLPGELGPSRGAPALLADDPAARQDKRKPPQPLGRDIFLSALILRPLCRGDVRAILQRLKPLEHPVDFLLGNPAAHMSQHAV